MTQPRAPRGTPTSRSEILALARWYSLRDQEVEPGYVTLAYFCPTVPPIRVFVTDQFMVGQQSVVHDHPCIAVHGCVQGPITFRGPDGDEVLDAGMFRLLAPRVNHQWANPGPGPAANIGFLMDVERPGSWPAGCGIGACCRELKQEVRGVHRFNVAGDPPLQQAFWQLADCLNPDRPPEPLVTTGVLQTFLGLVLERLRPASSARALQREDAQRIRRLLVERLHDRLTIDEVAARVHMSPTRAKLAFRRAFGCGIMEYFTRLKIQQAKRLLCDPALTVKQVSQRLGFSSPAYFDQVFRRLTGALPSEFRAR